MSTAFMRERRGWFAQSAVLVALIFAMLATSISPVLAAGGQFGNLSGTVIDQATKAGVPGAKVTVVSPSGTYRQTANGSGQFSILGVPVDTYLVTVEATGYQPATLPGISILGDQTQGLGNIVLSKELKEIGKVAARAQSGAFQPT